MPWRLIHFGLMLQRDEKILVQFLLFAAGLVFEPLARLNEIILFRETCRFPLSLHNGQQRLLT
jgi:hypothetical protein